jgi:hypothetical protein
MPKIPFALKVAYTAFMAVLIPVYWYFYGPTNFLYFCDVALILTLVGVWRESALLISMCTVGIVLPQMLWVLDFGFQLAGSSLTGMTAYMFNAERSLFLRGLSLFHGWIPFLLLYLTWKTGYDKRAFPAWTILSWALLSICYFFLPPPTPAPGMSPVNVNYVWGFSDYAPQHWMPAWMWFGGLFVVLPLVLFFPMHGLLSRFAPKAS